MTKFPHRSRQRVGRGRRQLRARHAAIASACRRSLGLEQLESRQVLAVSVGDTTTFTLAGTTPSDGVGDTIGEYDQLVVAGQATPGRTIAVQFAPGYVPQEGDRFTVMTYDSVVGRYASGRGLFGLAGDLWFEIEQTGDLTHAGAVTLVAHEVLPGVDANLQILESDGAVAATVRDNIGTFLNRDYFGADLQVTFAGGFTYGELDLAGTVVLRADQHPELPDTTIEADVTGTATVGTAAVGSGEFAASIGWRDGGPRSLIVCGQGIALDVAIGGATFEATSGRIGLVAGAAGVAFEATAAVSASLASDLSLSATEIVVAYNGTAVDYTGGQVSAGGLSSTFGSLAAGTFGIDVSGGELNAGGFLRAVGGFAIRGDSRVVTLSDGTTVTADILTIGGAGLGGFVGSGLGSAAEAGASITGGEVAAVLVTEKGGQSRRWLTVEGSVESGSVGGIAGVAGSLAGVSLTLNLDASDGTVVDYSKGKTSLSVAVDGTSAIQLAADGSKGQTVRATGTASLGVNGGLSLDGTMSLGLEGTCLVALGTAISGQLGSADAQTYLKVTGGSFGLLADGGGTAFELQGGLLAAIAGLASVSGDAIVAQYTSANVAIKAGRKLDIGTTSYAFSKGIAKDTNLFVVEGFEASVSDFVSLSGDVGFRKDADTLVAVGSNVAATLDAGSVASLSATGGSFGLSVAAGKTAFELAGAFSGTIAGLADLSADTALVRYTSAGASVTKGQSLTVGSSSYTFSSDIAAGTAAFTATGLKATAGSAMAISGDVGFSRDASGIVATGSKIAARLTAGTSYAEVADASLGLVATSTGTAVEVSDGSFSASLGDLADIKASSALARYTTADMDIAKGRTIDVGGVVHTFTSGIAKNTLELSATSFEANVSNFVSLSGDVGFGKDADTLVAVGSSVSATLTAGSVASLSATGGSFGLSVAAGKTAFELAGAFAGSITGLADLSADTALVRYTSAGTTVTKGQALTVGSSSYTFSGDIAAGTAAFTATGLKATAGSALAISGDVGFSRDASGIVATGSKIAARLTTGTSYAEVADASLGLVATSTGTAVEVSDGSFSASLGDLADIKAASALARFSTADTEIAKGRVIDVGGVVHTFTSGIAKNTLELSATSFEANVSSFVSLSGDIGFGKNADSLVAVGSSVSATLTAGNVASLSATGGSFGLSVAAGKTAFELAGAFAGSIAGLADLSADTALVRYASTGTTVTKGQALTVGSSSYTFSGDIAAGTAAFTATGLKATAGSALAISGDVGFSRDASGIVATGSKIAARLTAGTSYAEVADASLGLVATSTGTAVEVSDGSFSASLGDLADVKAASALARFTTADMEIAKGRVIDVGGVVHTFTSGIAKNTLELSATSFEANVSNFVSLSGDIGFGKNADSLVAVGANVSATLTAGNVASLSATGGSFGLSVAAGKTAFELAGAFTGSITGLADLSADTALVRYASAGVSVAKGQTLTVGSSSYTFSGDIAAGTAAFAATGIKATAGSSLAISGDVGFGRDASGIVATGSKIAARLTAGSSFVEVANASLGLVATSVGTALEVSDGSFSASLGDLVDVKAASALARYTTADMEIAKGRTIDIGGVTHTFADGVAKDALELAAAGFEANISNFVSLSGDVGFGKDADSLVAVGSSMSATLTAGSGASLSVSDGAFGLSVAVGQMAFELAAKNFQFQISGLPEATAETVFLRYTSANRAVAKNETLSVAGISYTFAEAIAKDTVAFSFTGFKTAVAEVLSISGGLGFARIGSDLIGIGSDIDVSLTAGSVASVTATDGSFGLIVNGSGVAFELQGGFSATIGGVFGASADRAIVQYASSGASIASGRRLAIGAAAYTFQTPIAASTVAFSVEGFKADVSGFVPLSGSLGFAVVGGELVAVGDDMSAGYLNDQYGGIRAEDGRFGLVANADGTAFELGGGSLRIQIADLTNVRAGSTFVQYSTAGITPAPSRKITAGGLDYTFTKGMAPGTSAFAVTGFAATVKDFVSLAGDVGFSIVDGQIIAVGDSVTARLAAGDYASLSVGGRFGLRVSGDQVALELSGTDLSASIADVANVKAESVFVQYTSPTASVAKNETLRVGNASYTFARPITAGTVAFDVRGLSADLFGVVTVSGDIGFALMPAEMLIAAYATDFSAAFKLGDQIEASVSHATFDIRVGSQLLFALQGETRLKLFGLIDETASVRIEPDRKRLTLDDGSQIDGVVLSFAAALPDLFFGKDAESADRVGVTLEDTCFGFAVATDLDSNRCWVAAKASASLAGFVGIDDFTATATDAAVVINTNTVIGGDGRSVDWSKTPLTLTPVQLGDAAAAAPITLDMKGQTLAASGTVHASLLGIAAIDGRFSFESSRRSVTLVGGATVDVDVLALGIQDASAFIGTTKDGVRKGLTATGVNLAFDVFRERSPAPGATARQWSLLDASVGSFAVVGIDGVRLAAADVDMGYIHLSEDGSSIDTSKPIAYDDKLSFSLGADRIRPGASSLFSFAGDFDVNVDGLMQFKDAIDIDVELDTLQIYDPVAKTHSSEDVATITFAALDRNIFAGDDSNGKRVGLELSGVDIAAAVAFGPQTGSVWVAVDASATGASTVGLTGFSLATQQVGLRINTPDYRGRVIDFKAQPLEIPTGLAIRAGDQGGTIWGDGQSTMLALDGTVGGEAGVIEITDAVLDVAGFLYTRGDYAFRIGQHTSGLVVNGLETGGGSTRLDNRFAVLSLAATNMDVFVGYRGTDEGGSSSPFDAIAPNGVRSDAVGLYARDIDFGYAVFTDGLHVFDSLKLDLPSAAFVGLGDKVTATLDDVKVGRNGGTRFLDARLAAIDFQQTFGPGGYTLTTPGGSVVLDATEPVQAVSAEVAKAVLKVDGFLDLSGALSFKSGGQIFGAKADAGLLKAIPGVSVTGLAHDLYTIEVGGTHLQGFAGATVDGRRVGVEIEDVSFGLAIMASTSISGITIPGVAAILPVYIAAKAEVGRASIVGADDIITATAYDVSIEVNTSYTPAIAAAFASIGVPGLYEASIAVLPMPALDLQGTAFAAGGAGLEIATGDPALPIVLDFRKEVIAAEVGYFDGDLAGSVQVAGSLAFAKRGGEKVTLTSGLEISVTSLGISMSDVRAFVGTGRYWGRNPETGRIDGTVTDANAAGFVVDDLDLGGVFMLDTSLFGLGVYAAARASMSSARLIGVEGFTAEVQSLSLDMNVGLNLGHTVVDFSRSTHGVVDQWGNITTLPGYAIAGPQNATPVVLSYDRALVRTQGTADFNLLGVVLMEGRFDLNVDATGLVVYVDGTGRLGAADGFHVEVSQFQAFLLVNDSGLVAKATLAVEPIVLGTTVSLTTDTLNLAINTTGKNVSYTIPEAIRRVGKPDAITVSAIPPGAAEAAAYVAASGGGELKILDSVTLAGSFDILLKSEVSTFNFDMMLDVPVLNPLAVTGSLQYVSGTDGGLVGSLQVGAANGANIFSTAGCSLNATMLLELNATPIERQVRSLRRKGESDLDGDGFVLRAVPAETLRIAGNGQILAGGVTIDGAVSLAFTSGRIDASLISEVDVGFGYLGVSGTARILYGEGRETAFVLDGRISGAAGRLGGVDGTVQINTGSADETLDNNVVVKANTDFDGRIAARIDIGLFTLDVGARLFQQNDVFEVRVDRGTLNFFDVATVSVTGFYRSTGAYLFDAAANFGFDVGPFTFTGALEMSLARDAAGNKTFKGSIVATSRYEGRFFSGDGPGLTAQLVFGPSSATFQATVTWGGFDWDLDKEWTWKGGGGSARPDPVIARLAVGVLTLSAGDDPLRYGDTNGEWYGSILNETFAISAVLDGNGQPLPGQVRVRSLGVEQTFTGVTRIVASGGDGNDVFDVGPGVDAVLQLDGGLGSDTILVDTLVAGSTFGGGDGVGYDTFGLPGLYADYELTNEGFGAGTISSAANAAAPAALAGIEGVRFQDRTVALGGYINSPPSAVALANVPASIAENVSTAPRIKVADIVVTDDGNGMNTLSLAGVDAGSFEIDGTVLYLRAGTVLDYEAKASLRVTVKARDEADRGSAAVTTDLVLPIANANDSPTAVTLSASSVAENQPAGTVVGTLSTTDPDAGDTFTYSLVPGTGSADNASFRVVGNALKTAAAFDHEARGSLTIRLRATDAGGLFIERAFTITVTDVNDAPTAVTLSASWVAENLPAGTAVGTLSTTDQDAGDSFTYSLVAGDGSADNASFQIVGGELRTAAVFDYEARGSLTIRLRAADAGGLFTERAVTITVVNVDDAPTAVALSHATVAENLPVGTVVGGLTTADQDSGETFTYSLVTGEGAADNASFQIVGGQLRTAVAFDHEAASNRTVRIRTTDSGGLHTEQPFTISVANVKEAPAISLPNGFTLVEDTPAPLAFTVPPFGTSDSPSTTRLTVSLRIERGTILATSAAGVTVGGTGQSRTFIGTITALNEYFTDPAGRIRYQPAANDAGSRVLAVAVAEATPLGILRSAASVTIEITPVEDAPRIVAPALFRVVEDRQTKLDWRSLGRAFADVDSASLQVTLSVASGSLDAISGRGVNVGGDAMHRTLTGSPAALAAFADLGRISYTTTLDATAPVTLEVEVFDGQITVRKEVPIVVTPQPDRPTLAATGMLAGPASASREISHADLLRATGARDGDGNAVRFLVENVRGGRLEAWNGSRWVPVRLMTSRYFTASPDRVTLIGPATQLRWRPDAAASVRPSITLRAWDGTLLSASACNVGFGDT